MLVQVHPCGRLSVNHLAVGGKPGIFGYCMCGGPCMASIQRQVPFCEARETEV
jgi:hypothetical protein